MERHAERIADDLKDIAVVSLHRLMQQGMMPSAQGFPLPGILLRECGAALNVGEEKRDGAGGKSFHLLFHYELPTIATRVSRFWNVRNSPRIMTVTTRSTPPYTSGAAGSCVRSRVNPANVVRMLTTP